MTKRSGENGEGRAKVREKNRVWGSRRQEGIKESAKGKEEQKGGETRNKMNNGKRERKRW